jgi:hypothetical protein
MVIKVENFLTNTHNYILKKDTIQVPFALPSSIFSPAVECVCAELDSMEYVQQESVNVFQTAEKSHPVAATVESLAQQRK